MKACQLKDGDSIPFQSFKLHWVEAIEAKWKPKIGPIHMMGFFFDPDMKHLPECSDSDKRKIISDVRHLLEICVLDDGDELFSSASATNTHLSTASEDSAPGSFSRRKAPVIDLISSDLFEDIIVVVAGIVITEALVIS